MRHRMKQKRPNRIVRTIRKAPVLLLKSVLLLLGSRSACVTAILCDPFFFLAQERYIQFPQKNRRIGNGVFLSSKGMNWGKEGRVSRIA